MQSLLAGTDCSDANDGVTVRHLSRKANDAKPSRGPSSSQGEDAITEEQRRSSVAMRITGTAIAQEQRRKGVPLITRAACPSAAFTDEQRQEEQRLNEERCQKCSVIMK